MPVGRDPLSPATTSGRSKPPRRIGKAADSGIPCDRSRRRIELLPRGLQLPGISLSAVVDSPGSVGGGLRDRKIPLKAHRDSAMRIGLKPGNSWICTGLLSDSSRWLCASSGCWDGRSRRGCACWWMSESEERNGRREDGEKGMRWWVSDGSRGEGGRESIGGNFTFNLFLPLDWLVLPHSQTRGCLVVYFSVSCATTPILCLKRGG